MSGIVVSYQLLEEHLRLSILQAILEPIDEDPYQYKAITYTGTRNNQWVTVVVLSNNDLLRNTNYFIGARGVIENNDVVASISNVMCCKCASQCTSKILLVVGGPIIYHQMRTTGTCKLLNF